MGELKKHIYAIRMLYVDYAARTMYYRQESCGSLEVAAGAVTAACNDAVSRQEEIWLVDKAGEL